MSARTRRAELRELRELDRRVKEAKKLSELETARLEVQAHEKLLEILLSVHKDKSDPRDWRSIAVALLPPRPERQSHHELRAKREAVLIAARLSLTKGQDSCEPVERARAEDDKEYTEALARHEMQRGDCERQKVLAQRVLARDVAAFTEVLMNSAPLTEISDLGVSAQYTVHDPFLVECAVRVRGTEIIPREVKTLTSTGKLSTRAMPKGRFHEIFQDYVCGSVLRVARELLDLLPLESILVTAFVESAAAGDGTRERPVLSAVILRSALDSLDCENIDPSDAMDHFRHRGDVKASRKTGDFTAIEPLTPTDVPQREKSASLAHMLFQVRAFRQELKVFNTELRTLAGQPATN